MSESEVTFDGIDLQMLELQNQVKPYSDALEVARAKIARVHDALLSGVNFSMQLSVEGWHRVVMINRSKESDTGWGISVWTLAKDKSPVEATPWCQCPMKVQMEIVGLAEELLKIKRKFVQAFIDDLNALGSA